MQSGHKTGKCTRENGIEQGSKRGGKQKSVRAKKALAAAFHLLSIVIDMLHREKRTKP